MSTRSKTSIQSISDLEEALSVPSPELIEELGAWDDGLIVLGAGGKMGPTLCRMAANAFREAGKKHSVTAVSRFSNPEEKEKLEAAGVKTISADLMDREAVEALPDSQNVVFAAGRKFGSTGAESVTWAMNAYLPGIVASRYTNSRIAVFSSGNVYPFLPPMTGGCTEETAPDPKGEYAQSVLGRERIFEYFSRTYDVPMTIIRLCYAVELRYGVLMDLAQTIAAGEPVDVTMGAVNVIWQRDANDFVLRSLSIAASPPTYFNLTGPETVSVRGAATKLAKSLDTDVRFVGEEAPEALLVDSSQCFRKFGYPKTGLAEMIELVSDWVKQGGETHGKPTGFQTRDGKF